MNKAYDAEVLSFGRAATRWKMTYYEAAECVRDGNAIAVVLDMLEAGGLESWWHQGGFPDIIRHPNFVTAATSGIAIGGLQRLQKDRLIVGLIDYFVYASKFNERLRQTDFVQLCMHELGAEPMHIGDWGELPLASRREFVRNEQGLYSVPPHCDAIHFGRDLEIWPFKVELSGGHDQLSTVLTIDESSNGAGVILWDFRPESRVELDEIMAEFAQTRAIRRLEGRRSLTVKARAGQMMVLNVRLLHAVEQCTSPRRTVGAFLLWSGGCWRTFH